MILPNQNRSPSAVPGRVPILRLFTLVVLLSLSGAAWSASESAEGVRTWTSVSGATVEARLVRVADGMVVLELEDGTRLSIALNALSPEDAERASQAVTEEAARPARAPAIETGPDKLPVFTSGPWAGYHAVYQHPHFDAMMDASGVLRVQLKDRGQPLGEPVRFQHSSFYNAPQQTGRPFAAFQDPPPPTMQPSAIELKGLLRHDVPFELTFEFRDNEISAWGRCEDPRDISFPTRFRVMISIPPSHQIDPSEPQERRIELVRGYELHMRVTDGSRLRWERYNYHDAQSEFSRTLREARIEAPNWNPRTVLVSSPSRDVPLRSYIYRGRALWQGYLFHLTKSIEQGPSRSSRDRLVLTIE